MFAEGTHKVSRTTAWTASPVCSAHSDTQQEGEVQSSTATQRQASPDQTRPDQAALSVVDAQQALGSKVSSSNGHQASRKSRGSFIIWRHSFSTPGLLNDTRSSEQRCSAWPTETHLHQASRKSRGSFIIWRHSVSTLGLLNDTRSSEQRCSAWPTVVSNLTDIKPRGSLVAASSSGATVFRHRAYAPVNSDTGGSPGGRPIARHRHAPPPRSSAPV